MTRAKELYEADLARSPTYHTGEPRKTWEQLGDIEQWSWGRTYAEPWRDPSAKREADADNEHATRVLIRKLLADTTCAACYATAQAKKEQS